MCLKSHEYWQQGKKKLQEEEEAKLRAAIKVHDICKDGKTILQKHVQQISIWEVRSWTLNRWLDGPGSEKLRDLFLMEPTQEPAKEKPYQAVKGKIVWEVTKGENLKDLGKVWAGDLNPQRNLFNF